MMKAGIGVARCWMSATSADTVFCTVAKPLRPSWIGLRKRGRSLETGDINLMMRWPLIAATRVSARPRVSNARALCRIEVGVQPRYAALAQDRGIVVGRIELEFHEVGSSRESAETRSVDGRHAA